MNGRSSQDLLALGDSALGRAASASAEVIAAEEVTELTRFAGNLIHQSVAERSLRLRARVIGDNRVGVAEIRGDGADSASRVMASADEARRLSEAGTPSPLPAPTRRLLTATRRRTRRRSAVPRWWRR